MMSQSDFFDEEAVPAPVNVMQLDLLGKSILDQRQEVDALKEKLEAESGKLNQLQGKMLSLLDQCGKDSWQIPGMANFGMTERLSVKLPGTPEEKEAFFQFLKERGIFEDLVSVNSQTLNSFYKKERDIAIEEGRSGDFKIPGLAPHSVSYTLSIRKGK